MASHYLFEPEFCNPASGWEKGQVEKNVQDARRRLWHPMPSFPDIDAFNAWLEAQCITQWGQIEHGVLPGNPMFPGERDSAFLNDGLGPPARRSFYAIPVALAHFGQLWRRWE